MMLVYIIAIYLVIGVLAVVTYDLITKRIRRNFKEGVEDAQGNLAMNGTYAGKKTASLFVLVATLIFWPLVFIGALRK